MTAALASASFAPRSGFTATLQAMPKAAVPLVVAAAVFSGCLLAGVPAVWLGGPADLAGPVAAVATAEPDLSELSPAIKEKRGRARCDTCGVVVAIQQLEAVGAEPAAYEFKVRLRDGSLQTRRTTSVGNWRSGDRIMLLGGAQAADADPTGTATATAN